MIKVAYLGNKEYDNMKLPTALLINTFQKERELQKSI
jgi:hypothetical protein